MEKTRIIIRPIVQGRANNEYVKITTEEVILLKEEDLTKEDEMYIVQAESKEEFDKLINEYTLPKIYN